MYIRHNIFLHKAEYMQVVAIIYNKATWCSLHLSYIIKRDGIVWDYHIK